MANPVLILHGIEDSSRDCVHLRRFLERAGRETHALDLVPNNGDAALERLAEQVAAYADAAFGVARPFDLVGFSMGGLVARYYATRLAAPGRVSRLVTVSSPHHGTWMAWLRGNAGARQMRPGSSFVNELNGNVVEGMTFTSVWSPLDLMIVPASSSVVAGARNVRVVVAAHRWMIRDQRVLRVVMEALRPTPDERTEPSAPPRTY